MMRLLSRIAVSILSFSFIGCAVAPVDPMIATIVDQVSADRIQAHIEVLAGFGPRTAKSKEATLAAVAYIERELESYGYTVEDEYVPYLDAETGETIGFTNLLATRQGALPDAQILEIGAHYDSVEGSPGADDNASGVAGVLEAARVLSLLKTKHSLRFVFFCLEEFGKGGSFTHVANALEREEDIAGAFIFEMIGYRTYEPNTQDTPVRIPFLIWPPTTGSFITVAGNLSSGWLGNDFESAADRYVDGLEYYSVNRLAGVFSDASRSDHEAYWNADVPAIMITDTANFRNPNYHEPSDTPDTIDPAFAQQVTQAAVAAMAEWAQPTRKLSELSGSLEAR